MYKEHKVVMIATDKSSDLILFKPNSSNEHLHHRKHYGTAWEDMGDKYQNLFIISDDEIKDLDWFINDQGVWQCNNGIIPTGLNPRKIIATTDKSLTWSNDNEIQIIDTYFAQLSQISQSFIEQYITEYNKGNIINDVLVEYEEYGEELGCDPAYYNLPSHRLKINQDNTINIKTVKDSFSRDEVRDLLDNLIDSLMDNKITKDISSKFYDKWIEQNL